MRKRIRVISFIVSILLIASLMGCGKQGEGKNITENNTMEFDGADIDMENDDIEGARDTKQTAEAHSDAIIEYIYPYSEGLAWIVYREDEEYFYGVIDKEGEVQFVLDIPYSSSEIETGFKTSCFSEGYAFVRTPEGIMNIDKEGEIMYTFPITDEWYSCADGYLWLEEYISGFDQAYYKYVLYDPKGNEVTGFEYEGTTGIGVTYCGQGVWRYSAEDDTGKYVQHTYCINGGKWIDSEFGFGLDYHNTNNGDDIEGEYFFEDVALIDMVDALHFMDSKGNFEDVPLPEDLDLCSAWNYSNNGRVPYVYENYCVFKNEIDYRDYNYYLSRPMHRDLINYSVLKKEFKKMDNEYAEKVISCPDLKYQGGKIVLGLQGVDQEEYAGIFDTSWNIVGEPIRADKFALSEGKLIVGTLDRRSEKEYEYYEDIKVYDDEGKELYSLSENGYCAVTAYQDGVARALKKDAYISELTENMFSLYSNIIYQENTIVTSAEWEYINEKGEPLFDTIDLSNAKMIEVKFDEKGE